MYPWPLVPVLLWYNDFKLLGMMLYTILRGRHYCATPSDELGQCLIYWCCLCLGRRDGRVDYREIDLTEET